MATLEVYYASEHAEHPILVTTDAEVDALVDRVRAESPDRAPILMQIYVANAEHEQEFGVGIRGDRGVLWYSGRDVPEGVYSTGEGSYVDHDLAYFHQDNWTGFPSNAEIPLTEIRRAFKQFLTTGGARPAGIQWQVESDQF